MSTFGKAFRDARNAGLKEFTFKGKKYTTKLAEEVEQPSVGGKPKAGEYVRRDMSSRMEEIDRETAGDRVAMNYVPRRSIREETEDTNLGDAGYKKGGYVKSADGCAKRGKTRGKMV